MKKLAILAVVASLQGCASSDWTRADTVAEVSWQVLNVVDAIQTNGQRSPQDRRSGARGCTGTAAGCYRAAFVWRMSSPVPFQAERPVECPRCSEVELVRVRVELVDGAGRTFFEYECGSCHHYETS